MSKAASLPWFHAAAVVAVASALVLSAGATERTAHAATTGLVAAYSLDQAGSAVTDLSGNGNNGTVSNATWTSAGKYGGAYVFNGTSSIITIPDSTSLDLTTGMTLEAWVKTAVADDGWHDIMMKEQPGMLVYSLYGETGTVGPGPGAEIDTNTGDIPAYRSYKLDTGVWKHVAATYDGSTLQLWVNGFVNVSVPASGSLLVSNGALRIGGDSIWGEYFNGTIDEVRIYKRALSQAEIQSDMNTPVGNIAPAPSPPQNTGAPTISGTPQQGQVLTANEGTWTDSPTFSYKWRRCDSAGATCVDVAGATAKTYAAAAADVGGTLRVVVTGTNAAGSSSATSAQTAVVTSAPPPPSSDVTVTVDRTQPDMVSQLALGVTHTQYSLDSWGNAAAIASAQSLLAATAPYQVQSIYGWGTTNPEPSSGVFDWSTLDARINLIRSMGATPVITLCCAPDWMTSLGSNTSTYSNVPPTPAHYADFANLAKQIAQRYPDVKNFLVWNEFKGFWSNSLNNWDYVAYTNMYNAVYDALKSVDPTIQVGGPYLTIVGTGSGSLGKSGAGTFDPVSAGDMQVIDYWLANKHGADFLAIDRSIVQPSQDSNTYSESQLLSLAHWFGDAVAQIRSHTGTALPIWYAEDYFNPDLANFNYSDAFQAVALSSLLYNELKSGVAVSLRWQPQGRGDLGTGDQASLFTDTRNAGGGQPLPYYADFKAFHDYFARGTQLYKATSSSPDVEVLASAAKTLLLNTRPTSITVSVNGAQITMAGYEVRVLDAGGPPPPADTTSPSAPGNVHATGSTPTSVSLAWNASTDNVGVAGYNVYANGSKVATTSSTSATAGGLSCGTSYTMGVEAFDAAGNVSSRSTTSAATGSCSDTTPPSAPTNLAQTASTQTSISISWSASTDNVGVTGYGEYLNGVRVASTSATTYTYSGLSCGTNYTIGVDASDAAGNRSAQTSMIATTSACAPPPPPPSGPCGWGTRPATWQHVVWIIFENKTYGEVIGSSSAPYINSIANQCGLATNFFAESHPSLPNYIAMTSGSTQGITDDSGPSSHPLNVPSIFSQLGNGWRSLEESMPSNCTKGDSGSYAVRHNPAAYYTNINCAAQDVPLSSTPDISAQFTFVTPNGCNDMHDCSVNTGDNWLSSFLPKILNSAQYQAGSTAVFITWDEDDSSSTNRVATIVVSPSTAPGTTSGTTYNHYAMLRTTEEMLGLSTFVGNAATAPSMRSAFGL